MSTLPEINLLAGWIGMLLGVASGAVLGLFFHRDDWAGGYGSHRRRLMRLGHIAFFGLGFLNIVFALTLQNRPVDGGFADAASYAMILGAATMPVCCFLTAWRRGFRHFFPIPVLALGYGIIFIIMSCTEVSS